MRACTDELRNAFHERCFDIDKKTHLAATEKAFLHVWLLLRRLPRELVDEARPEELTHLRKRHSAIELHAIGICIGSTQLRAQEAVARCPQAGGTQGNRRRPIRLEQAEIWMCLIAGTIVYYFRISSTEQPYRALQGRPWPWHHPGGWYC